MGIYLNPTNQRDGYDKATIILAAPGVLDVTRTEFLAVLPGAPDSSGVPIWPVCVVGNDGFVAAGVAYSQDEARAFADPRDLRPKFFCLVPESTLEVLDPACAAHLAAWRPLP